MQRLLDLMGTPDIKIITGVRRSGKSELMKAYIRRIREIQPEANIIFVDFFDLKYEGLKEYHALYDYIESHYAAGKQNYVFVDEVQLCEKFELAINSLHTSHSWMKYSFVRNLSWRSTACILRGNMIFISPVPMPSF